MKKFFKLFSNWHKSSSIPKEKDVKITGNSYEFIQNNPVPSQKVSFNSPSEPKKPHGNGMAIPFDDQNPYSRDKENMNNSDYMVAFSGLAKSYCVGIVDMVNSTKISAGMNEFNWCMYYETFLNSMAKIITSFGGKIIKNQGDSLLYYFPETSKSTKSSFLGCIDCSLAMIEARADMCKELAKKRLPMIDYRISLDYGRVVIMTTSKSSCDLIGPPVNMCSKINRAAPKNGVVIGRDLHSMVSGLGFTFKEIKGFSLGFKQSYPIFSMETSNVIYKKS